MTSKYFIVLSLILFTCCNDNKVNNDKAITPLGKEKFTDFFERFCKDSTFQDSRIMKPLLVEETDEESNDENSYTAQTLDNVHVSFNQADWNESIITDQRNISNDMTIIDLKGKETGLLIEHYFILNNNKWYLSKIRDLSD